MAISKCSECKGTISTKAKVCPNCGADQRNWIRRHPIFSIILFLLVIGILNNITKTGEQTDYKLITLSEFNKIETGMSYFEVIDIIGSEGTVLSENEIGGFRTVMYQFKGSGVGNASVMIQNGKVTQKSQFGLE